MGIVPTPESDRARFWAKVDKYGPVPEARPELGPCWLWTAALFSNGYGAFRLGSKQRRAHVVSFEWHVSPTNGLQVCHHCDVKRCVNPTHLFPGTQWENVQDARSKGRLPTGERNGMHTQGLTILTDDQVREIHALCSAGAPQQAVADVYGVTQNMISRIMTGKAWEHLNLPTVRCRAFKARPMDATIRAIRRMAEDGIPYREIGRAHDCSAGAAHRIATRQVYPDVE